MGGVPHLRDLPRNGWPGYASTVKEAVLALLERPTSDCAHVGIDLHLREVARRLRKKRGRLEARRHRLADGIRSRHHPRRRRARRCRVGEVHLRLGRGSPAPAPTAAWSRASCATAGSRRYLRGVVDRRSAGRPGPSQQHAIPLEEELLELQIGLVAPDLRLRVLHAGRGLAYLHGEGRRVDSRDCLSLPDRRVKVTSMAWIGPET